MIRIILPDRVSKRDFSFFIKDKDLEIPIRLESDQKFRDRVINWFQNTPYHTETRYIFKLIDGQWIPSLLGKYQAKKTTHSKKKQSEPDAQIVPPKTQEKKKKAKTILNLCKVLQQPQKSRRRKYRKHQKKIQRQEKARRLAYQRQCEKRAANRRRLYTVCSQQAAAMALRKQSRPKHMSIGGDYFEATRLEAAVKAMKIKLSSCSKQSSGKLTEFRAIYDAQLTGTDSKCRKEWRYACRCPKCNWVVLHDLVWVQKQGQKNWQRLTISYEGADYYYTNTN